MVIEEKFIKAVLMQYIVVEHKYTDVKQDNIDSLVDNLPMDNATATSLAESISKHVNITKKDKDGVDIPAMTRVTIGRFLGIFGNKRGHVNSKNLQILADYLGVKSWDEVLNKKSLKDFIFTNIKLQDAKEKITSEYAKGKVVAIGESVDYLLSKNIPVGYFVEIRYGDDGKFLKFRKVKDTDDRFVVVESDSHLIKKGYSLTIPFFILNSNLIGTDVYMNQNIRISLLYRSSGTTRSIHVTML